MEGLVCSYKALLEETVTQGHRAAVGQVSKEVNSGGWFLGEEEGSTDVEQLQQRGILRAACDSYYATHTVSLA